MKLGDTVLYKGKPVKIFGSQSELFTKRIKAWCIVTSRGRIRWVTVKSGDLREVTQ